MSSQELRLRFLTFFEKRGHTVRPSAPLVPENDPSVLFTTAGMQQFKPYFLGEKSPWGKNVVSVQKCVRTSDIDEIGDETHLTFFEMLGNFSFGGYFKKEAIQHAHEFITQELKLPISYVTIFGGGSGVEKDTESKMIWHSLGITDIREEGMDSVFWGPTGGEGPCGPTTEIYCKNAAGQDVEIWNIVFNQFYFPGTREELLSGKSEKKLSPLENPGIDTGMGLERLLMIKEKKKNVFETDLFSSLIEVIKESAKTKESVKAENIKAERIVTDHLRTAVFLINDGVWPSNKERGYVLRRLLRRAQYFFNNVLGCSLTISALIKDVADIYKNTDYKFDIKNIEKIVAEEEAVFKTTLDYGEKFFQKIVEENNAVSEKDLFFLFSTHGLPFEMISELAKKQGISVDVQKFNEELKKHQELSRTSAAGKFKGGLADDNPATIKLHTAHHLLLAALQNTLGKEVKQRGSNITSERLRMDFSFGRKLTDLEKQKVEELVNQWIALDLQVVKREMNREEAEKIGAEREFGAKYPEKVSVYFIEDSNGEAMSKEFCGGPHVRSTAELGRFKIVKEEAVSQGIRRIKAVLE